MKRLLLLLLGLIFIISCKSDDKTIDVVNAGIERGVVLRNIERVSSNVINGDLSSFFSVLVEEQDVEEGGLLDRVILHVRFVDRTPENGDFSTVENVLKEIPKSEFLNGPFDLPRTTMTATYEELVQATGADFQSILSGDQFEIRAELILTDGRSFSNDSGSASILTDDCFFKSPFRYVVNVITPIDDSLFTGIYFYEFISDIDFFGLATTGLTTINAEEESNVRTLGILSNLQFTVAGSSLHPKIYQSINFFCPRSNAHILSGPVDTLSGQLDQEDDTVFDLDFTLGYEGWDGQGGTNVQEVRIRFTKQ